MAGKAHILFQDETTNTDSAEKCLAVGDAYVFLSGVFDGATVTIEMESPNFPGVWMPVAEGVFTEPQVWFLLRIRDNTNIRAVTTDAGGSTSVSVEISK